MAAGIESFLAEVAIVPYNFVPRGWAYCEGQLLAISSNAALFSLMGTFYGGNGTSNFGLPNLKGAVVIGVGTSTTGFTYVQGQTGGTTANALTVSNLPSHTHAVSNALAPLAGGTATTKSPVNNYPGNNGSVLYSSTANGSSNVPVQTSGVAIGSAGSGQAYANLQTYVGVAYIIATTGIFPPRS
jgi:microcystin-dependent protein